MSAAADPSSASDSPGIGRFDARGRVRAAGGVVWRIAPVQVVEVLLVHRPAYDDWTFPKGKRDEGETDEQTAVREVEEETGLRCVPGRELASVAYLDGKGRAKVARYWEMTVADGTAGARNEVDDVQWLRVRAAAERLTYEHDLDVLRSFADFAGL
jgi:8-oxo-dGTP pyrophosphatase MutT (NUDIX family)